MINLRLDGAVRTLILTLRARADEQKQEAPLIHDPWSAEWYEFMPEVKLLEAWYNPNFQLATAIRTRLIDEAVTAFIEAHDNPLVIELGAGFSTRYFRLGEGKSTWIELDLDEAIAVRRKIDIEINVHWFIASDMSDLHWLNLLPDFKAKDTLFIAEASLMFLEPAAVQTLINALADRFGGASFVFDVINPDYMEQVNSSFSDINAQIRWAVHADELDQYALKVVDTRFLLLEFPERWDALGVDHRNRTQEQSGYVVVATLA